MPAFCRPSREGRKQPGNKGLVQGPSTMISSSLIETLQPHQLIGLLEPHVLDTCPACQMPRSEQPQWALTQLAVGDGLLCSLLLLELLPIQRPVRGAVGITRHTLFSHGFGPTLRYPCLPLYYRQLLNLKDNA